MDHFADDVMHATSYAAEDPVGSSPLPGRLHLSGILTSSSKSDAADPVKVPAIPTNESETIRSIWQRKQNNLNTVFWVEIEGDPLNPVRAERLTVAKRLTLMLRDYCVGLCPARSWLNMLDFQTIKADVIAGLSVGKMIIPQSMSYANIAVLDVKYGLYSSVIPIITYAFLGTSRQLAVGPVAMVSLLVEVGLADALTEDECPAYFAQQNGTLAESDWTPASDLCPDAYAELAILTSLLVGVFQTVASFLRLGFLVSFLGHPVVSGFTSGAAIIIGLSQLKDFVGYSIPKSQYFNETVKNLFSKIDQTKWYTLVMGLLWWFMLWSARKAAQKYKRLSWLRACAPLIVCTIGIFIGATWSKLGGCSFDYCNPGEKQKYIVGDIPSGFPPWSGNFDFSKIGRCVSTAFSASLIGYMESIAISKSLAAKHKYEVVPGQELFALGVANILGSLTSSYPVTGSFSRSAVNNMVGCKTNLSGAVTGVLVMLILLVLTAPFKFLPKFCLAAIVVSSVTNLIDTAEARHLWKVKKADFCLWILAFFGVLFAGVQNGLLGAISASLVIVIYESVRPQISVLWRLPETPIYRNIKQESLGQFVPGVLIVRLGASMYFANVSYIRDHIRKLVTEFSGGDDGLPSAALTKTPVRYIVMEMTPVVSVDSTAVHMLEDMHRDLKERGVRVAFATVGNRVEQTLRRAGVVDKIGAHWFCPSVHAAVQFCVQHQAKGDASKDGNGGGGGAAKQSAMPVLDVQLEEEEEESDEPARGVRENHDPNKRPSTQGLTTGGEVKLGGYASETNLEALGNGNGGASAPYRSVSEASSIDVDATQKGNYKSSLAI